MKVFLVGVGKWVEVRVGENPPVLEESEVVRKGKGKPMRYYDSWGDVAYLPSEYSLKIRCWVGGKVLTTLPRESVSTHFRNYKRKPQVPANGGMVMLTSTQVRTLEKKGVIPCIGKMAL